jgi:hypothetical protein
MADYNNPKTILSLEVDYAQAVDGVQKLQKEIQRLKEEQDRLKDVSPVKDGIAAYEEAQKQLIINNERIKEYQYNVRALSKEIQNNARIEKANEEKRTDSLNSLRASLSILTRQYDELGAAERRGERGEKLRGDINKITTEIKNLESETQRYFRNVGNYENAIQNMLGLNSKWFQSLSMIKDVTAGGLKQGLQATTQAVSAFGKQLLALLANPIVATLAAIAAAVMAVSKAIKSSEENTNLWNQILAPFQRILTGVLSIIQDIVTAILSWVTNGAKLVGWIMTMMEKLPVIGNFLKMINNELRESIAIAQTDADLAKQRREMEVQNAKDQLEIAKLRKRAATEAQKDRKAQMADLKRADELEKGIMKRRMQYAKTDLENARKKAAQSQNDAATNDEIAQKEAAYYQAQTAYYQGTMRMASGISSAEKSLAKEYTATGKAVVDTAQKIEEAKKKELDAVRAAEDALTKLIKDDYERQRAELNITYTRRIEDLKKRLATEKDLTLTARAAIMTEIKAQEELLQQELNRISIENLEKRVQQEQERLGYLLDVVKDDWLKRRELQLQQIAADEALQESRIAKEIQDEQKRSEVLHAMHLAFAAKRQAVELEFDKSLQDARIKALTQDYETRIREAGDNELEVERLKAEEKLKILENSHQLEGESIEAWNERKLQMERDYQDQKKSLAKKEVEIEQAKAKAIAAAVGALSDMLEEAAGENKSLAMASKILALAEIAINSGVAIAAGIKQAQSVPFPANLAAIATTTATILAGITSAIKTVKSAKFAGGGLVRGAGTGTSDSISARLSNGESVMTAGATSLFSPLLSALNQLGGGVPIIATTPQQQIGEDMLAAAVAKGMALAPRPVVAVTDIAREQNKVQVIEDVSTL